VESIGERRILADAQLVVPVSSVLDEQLEEAGIPISRRLLLENAVDLQEFTRASVERRNGTNGRFVVGWVGSFRPLHALHLIPSMLDELRRRISYVELRLIGDGPLAPDLARRLAAHGDAVRFIGAVPHAKVPAYVRDFDVAVLPTERGSFHYSPMKLFEYLASGVPVVAGDTGQVRDVLEQGGGILVPPGDAGAMAAALERLATNPSLRAKMSAQARATAERWGSWDWRARTLLESFAQRGWISADAAQPSSAVRGAT
jgi:glycosyltransferase involved in cell wall biosynthesis